MQHSFLTLLHLIRRESQGVAGGNKWTYEATFLIAMKGGRAYHTTAAHPVHNSCSVHSQMTNNTKKAQTYFVLNL
jgi:hypothetical protein